MNININEALKKVNLIYSSYFKYKFNELQFDQSVELKSEVEFLKSVNRKSMNSFTRWERTEEYKSLVTLYLNQKAMKDYEAIYKIVSEKALQGDDKMIKTFLSLQKDIQLQSQLASKYFEYSDEVTQTDDSNIDDDELML